MGISIVGATPRALWLDRLDPPIEPRPSWSDLTSGGDVEADREWDVVIVGGGFSGLWTAYYLNRLDPSRSVLVLEREYCGFGASGRNGGWCVGELAGSFERYATRSSSAEALRLNRAVFDAVDEVGRIAEAEGIDCHYTKGGVIRVARNRPQAIRQQAEVAHHHSVGFTSDEIRLLTAEEARHHLNATDVHTGIFFAPAAALDPARLVRGLAEVVEQSGVTIAEQTAVSAIEPGRVVPADGPGIRARSVIRATEGYTRDLHGARRDMVPIYSLMVATEPLDEAVFDQIGLAGRPTFCDDRYMVIYGQRTADNRLAFGGRGVPYLFGSAIKPGAETLKSAHQLIADTLLELFPVLDGIRVTHRWGGVLGMPRNWLPGLHYRPDGQGGHTGTMGGYVGEGVAASNLAGRTMAELICGVETERTNLPWVGVSWPKWEPEPLRWLGVRGSRSILLTADNREFATDREAKLAARVAHWLRDGSLLAR